jgi:hypothetical protein
MKIDIVWVMFPYTSFGTYRNFNGISSTSGDDVQKTITSISIARITWNVPIYLLFIYIL